MEKFIPFKKLSKKEQRRKNREKRSTWGALSPVTRRSKNPKAYDRRKAQRSDPTDCAFFVPLLICPDRPSTAPASARPGRYGR